MRNNNPSDDRMITPRAIKFKIAKCNKKYWFDDDPVKTLHANTLTSSIPYGERFFVSCMISHLKKIKNKTLKKEALSFIRQEMNHSKAHYRLYLKVVKPFYPKLKTRNCLYQKFFVLLALLLGNKVRLAIVAAMEHFTAVSGAYYLQNEKLIEGVDETIHSIFKWHFIEEVEHKAVAYDILQETGHNYFVRILGFFLAFFFLLSGFLSSFLHMVWYDKLYKSRAFYKNLFSFFLGKEGMIRKLWRPYLKYLLPHFHPSEV